MLGKTGESRLQRGRWPIAVAVIIEVAVVVRGSHRGVGGGRWWDSLVPVGRVVVVCRLQQVLRRASHGLLASPKTGHIVYAAGAAAAAVVVDGVVAVLKGIAGGRQATTKVASHRRQRRSRRRRRRRRVRQETPGTGGPYRPRRPEPFKGRRGRQRDHRRCSCSCPRAGRRRCRRADAGGFFHSAAVHMQVGGAVGQAGAGRVDDDAALSQGVEPVWRVVV